jgi:hypothetical protein
MLKTKFWRDSLFQTLLYLMFEYVLIVAIAAIIGQEDVFLAAVFGIAALYILRIGNAILHITVTIPIYYISKRRLINAVVAQFYQNNLPVRNNLAFLGASEYMQEVANSKDTPDEVRRFLDRSLGELEGLRTAGMVPFLRMNAVLDAAIERYVSEKNARSETPTAH